MKSEKYVGKVDGIDKSKNGYIPSPPPVVNIKATKGIVPSPPPPKPIKK
jgi:hypothetical protein